MFPFIYVENVPNYFVPNKNFSTFAFLSFPCQRKEHFYFNVKSQGGIIFLSGSNFIQQFFSSNSEKVLLLYLALEDKTLTL